MHCHWEKQAYSAAYQVPGTRQHHPLVKHQPLQPAAAAAKQQQQKRETALDGSWKKLRLILRRGRPICDIVGAKAHANVLKGTFSTDGKSNCIRIGLTAIMNPYRKFCSKDTINAKKTKIQIVGNAIFFTLGIVGKKRRVN